MIREDRRRTRRGLRMAGVVLAVAGLAMAVLATRMTDIGHFTGLVASAGAMFAGAAVLWVQASRIG